MIAAFFQYLLCAMAFTSRATSASEIAELE